eukprot:c9936_g1_i1.p2 GENE.c9936_g1_i1~~c9936_g1_i1.p2  ORF type:complete len:116 (+),score=22.45 c9936_g1_i1:416-763(+)
MGSQCTDLDNSGDAELRACVGTPDQPSSGESLLFFSSTEFLVRILHKIYQAHIAQHMLATSDLATRTFTNAAQQSSQLKQSQTQFSSCKFPVIDPSMPCQCSDDNFWSQWTKQSS